MVCIYLLYDASNDVFLLTLTFEANNTNQFHYEAYYVFIIQRLKIRMCVFKDTNEINGSYVRVVL